jgi:hypothetical protein
VAAPRPLFFSEVEDGGRPLKCDHRGRTRAQWTCPDRPLEDAAEHVCSHGTEVFGPHHCGDATDAYFFYDPDDNLVEFYAYVDA